MTVPAQACAAGSTGSVAALHTDRKQASFGPGTGNTAPGEQTLRETGQNQHSIAYREETSEASDTWAERTGHVCWV